ncbi:MAG TPA: TIGR02147 family protein [Fibrobacteria bacterium]|nr:TIGR02147 family protein [Fibrobacteria bacterium]
MQSPGPDIHLYADYRQYLKDWWAWRKRTSRTASFRSLAMKAGTSPSLFKDILEGRRRLTADSVIRFSPALGLTQSQSSYLGLLARFGNARGVQEKNEAFQEMAKIRRKLFLKFLPPEQHALWTTWLHAALREMVGLERFKEDPTWISQRLQPPVPVKEVREALGTLEKLGLVKRDARGRLQASELAVSSEYETPSSVVRHFNQEMIGLAMSASDRFSAVDREIGGLTLGLNRECYDRIKERVRLFKEEILGMVVEDKRGSDLVGQLNIQLFPLAMPGEGP